MNKNHDSNIHQLFAHGALNANDVNRPNQDMSGAAKPKRGMYARIKKWVRRDAQ